MRPILVRLFIFILFTCGYLHARNRAREYLTKGWQELVKDNDALALQDFSIAYDIAYKDHDILTMADALLNMGIASYGSSAVNGLNYAMQALEQYAKAENENPVAAREGKYRCLQLISTIYSRQGKYRQAIFISHRVLKGLNPATDTTGTYGLALSSIGNNYAVLGRKDSSEWYHKKALEQYTATGNSTYIPGGYVKLGNIYLEKKQAEISRNYFERAFKIADSTGNRQALVMAMNSLGDWELVFGDRTKAEDWYIKSKNTGFELTDKTFLLSSLNKLTKLYKTGGDDHGALIYSEQIQQVKDSLAGFEREQLVRNLEVQMEISEKTKQLELAEKEKNITRLKNYFLYAILTLTVIASCFIIYNQKKIHNRDKEIRKKKEEVQQSVIEQQRLKDVQLRNEIDYKESQLSALTLQMLQKNELLQELREKLENGSKDPEISKVVNKGFNQDKDWEDFNLHFESINRNFYAKVRETFPGISPNELKICALIKLNLSIKEMASILNISPDSVKTARYRLRKKLQLNTEDNLTEFIQGIS